MFMATIASGATQLGAPPTGHSPWFSPSALAVRGEASSQFTAIHGRGYLATIIYKVTVFSEKRLEIKSLKGQTKAEELGGRPPDLLSLRLSLKAGSFKRTMGLGSF